MSTKGADQVTVNDNAYANNNGGTAASHELLAASGAYAPQTAGKANTDGKAATTTSSGASWHTGEGFLNLLTGMVITSNETPVQMRSEMSNASTATGSLNNAREDFLNGNNDVGIQDLKAAKTAMDADPNMSRQALHLDWDLKLTQAASYIPFFGASIEEHFGQDAAAISQSTGNVERDVAQAVSHRANSG